MTNLHVYARNINPFILLDRIFGRASLRTFLKTRSIKTAAEIGVQQGINAATIIRRAKPSRMVLADPYEGYSEEIGLPYSEIEKIAHQKLKRKNCEWIKSGNRDVISGKLGVAAIDYLYVDAAHDYDSVTQDIEAYWPCVAKGGMMAGHDIVWPSVFRAIANFQRKHDVDVQCSGTDWWITKQ